MEKTKYTYDEDIMNGFGFFNQMYNESEETFIPRGHGLVASFIDGELIPSGGGGSTFVTNAQLKQVLTNYLTEAKYEVEEEDDVESSDIKQGTKAMVDEMIKKLDDNG